MRSLRGAAVVAALAVLLAGCGHDGVAPRDWASRVCQALKPWTEEIATLTEDTQTEMSKATTPQQAKKSIVGLLRGAEDASAEARRGVEVAGVPAVDNGERIAREFRAALSSARDAYGKARRSIEKLSTKSADAFYDGVVAAMDTLSKDYDAGDLDTDSISSEELQTAFDEAPDCQG